MCNLLQAVARKERAGTTVLNGLRGLYCSLCTASSCLLARLASSSERRLRGVCRSDDAQTSGGRMAWLGLAWLGLAWLRLT